MAKTKTATKSKTTRRTATDVFTDINRAAEQHRRDLPLTIDNMSAGDAYAQGDVVLEYVGETLADALKHMGLRESDLELTKDQLAQLAPGNTKGSRHILQDMTHVKVYRNKKASPIDGPVLAFNGCDEGMVLTHPQHPWHYYNQPGFYQVHYQRSAAEELKRRLD